MCAICGILNLTNSDKIDPNVLRTMVSMVRHRGPDEAGTYMDDRVGLGHARLSIIDLSGGKQPLCNEDRSVWVVFNGEIFNYIELRRQLESLGHSFRTDSDTETIVHAYEEYGHECLRHFNGQFAFALWDSNSHELFLARDRLGIRPLFYCIQGGRFIFGSEIKSIAAHPAVNLEIDPAGLDEVFTFWATLAPASAFKEICEVPAGHYVVIRNGDLNVKQYWSLEFPSPGSEPVESEEHYAEALREHLIQSTRLQLRSDVPVGAYLSGGLDSSIITTIIKKYTSSPLITFSIRFEDSHYDEGGYQAELIKSLGTRHSEYVCSSADIAEAFTDVIWHTEKPILRTAPTPLFFLSRLVREKGFKVVLTGEGADEFLGGYNIFKEAKIRRFWARQPESKLRPLLLQKLYPYLAQASSRPSYYWQTFFRTDLSNTDLPYYSHIPRWSNTAKIKTLFSERVKSEVGHRDTIAAVSSILNPNINRWAPLSRAQWVEAATFLSPYLLSSQGDRVAMAHSVESRFPFLDHNVVEFCSLIPPKYKLRVLNEKYILKKCMSEEIPSAICRRPKQPYRAPDSVCFLGAGAPEYVKELLSERELARTG
ncbi:asparagine synthase (glutamine-hydrolyzing), partial [Candidatus Poribacteria bacterium]|nr:asparagine synthase (glutamine-hydrolyzing) [Candidatus Poribacteria bacterium]